MQNYIQFRPHLTLASTSLQNEAANESFELAVDSHSFKKKMHFRNHLKPFFTFLPHFGHSLQKTEGANTKTSNIFNLPSVFLISLKKKKEIEGKKKVSKKSQFSVLFPDICPQTPERKTQSAFPEDAQSSQNI